MKKSVHKEAIVRVLAYIDEHKDSALDLETLSQVSHVSKFHFHRIFKDYIGISLGQYIKLKRLETGIWRLVFTVEKTLEMDAGYESHSAFTRAFTKEMKCSPKEFKERFYKEKRIALNKLQQKGPQFLGYQSRAVTNIFYFRRLGSYFQTAAQAWKDLINDLNRSGIDVKAQTYYGISQDDPNALETETNSLRFDVCVESNLEIKRQENNLKAKKGQIPDGRYAVFLHTGPLEKLSDSYYFIYGKWIHDNSVRLRDIRPFIKYIAPFSTEVTDKYRETEIYLPVDS